MEEKEPLWKRMGYSEPLLNQIERNAKHLEELIGTPTNGYKKIETKEDLEKKRIEKQKLLKQVVEESIKTAAIDEWNRFQILIDENEKKKLTKKLIPFIWEDIDQDSDNFDQKCEKDDDINDK